MNVAPATLAASRPFTFMTARNGETVEKGAGTGTPTPVSDAEPLVNRFPTIAFSYDVDASRQVMLYRDPANGKTVSQIPTEAALKHYKEAQQREKSAARASSLEVTVGGAEDGPKTGGSPSGGAGASSAKAVATNPAPAQTTSVGSAHVAHFSATTMHPAAASTGAARVNVVI